MLPVAILAGGLATRLRPATEKIPKSLLEVNGEAFIAHQLRLLKANGVSQVVLCVGFLGEMVRDVVKNGRDFGLNVHYSFDGPALLGTAGALKRARNTVLRGSPRRMLGGGRRHRDAVDLAGPV